MRIAAGRICICKSDKRIIGISPRLFAALHQHNALSYLSTNVYREITGHRARKHLGLGMDHHYTVTDAELMGNAELACIDSF